MIEEKNNVQIDDRNGNSTKPLLCDGFYDNFKIQRIKPFLKPIKQRIQIKKI